MPSRRETPFLPITDLFGGEFRRGRSYYTWRPRGSGDWLLIYTVAGAGSISTPHKKGSTRIGEAILYAPGEFQDYKTDPTAGHWHLLWVHFLRKPTWQPLLQWPTAEHGVKSLQLPAGEVRDHFRGALERLVELQKRRLPSGPDFCFNALEEALLWAHLAVSRGPWMRIDPRIRRAMDYLASDLRAPFRLEELAQRSGLSVSRLAHLFKSEAGFSPQQFFEQQRMWHAGQLLQRTGLSVAEIAAEVGYEDPFYFSNRFRRHSKSSPSEFRRRKQSKVAATTRAAGSIPLSHRVRQLPR